MSLNACVPKAQYQEQEDELQDTKAQLKSLEQTQTECDPDTFLQLKEQAQSLDILQQELLDRNTELSEEVARLRVYEAQAKSQDMSCGKKLEDQASEYEAQISRTKETYDDLIKDLRSQIRDKDGEIAAYRRQLTTEKAKPAEPSKATSGAKSKSAVPAPKKDAPSSSKDSKKKDK